MEQRVIKMAALGRRFQIGDLYDYRSDRILNSKNIILIQQIIGPVNVEKCC